MQKLIIGLFLILGFSLSHAGDLARWSAGLRDGILIPNSESPNRQYALFEVHATRAGGWQEYAREIVLATLNRTRVVGLLEPGDRWEMGRDLGGSLRVMWSPDGRYFVMKESKAYYGQVYGAVHLFRVGDGRLERVRLPDARRAVEIKMTLPEGSVTRVGEEPIQWEGSNQLRVRAKFWRQYSQSETDLTLVVEADGRISYSGGDGCLP